MRLTPSDPDIQTLILRIQSNQIDLQPDFQRGEVWPTPKKQRLVDSILRDWHIPPIHVIVDPDTALQMVLDGQQRLAAIRDFVNGEYSVDGRIEPITPELQMQHGKRYSGLALDLKRRFDQFTIRVFKITDYSPAEPGELFYRLNQPTALTAAEQRNAFFGETRRQIKSLVQELEVSRLDETFWGFTNARMAYDDILSRTALFLEQNSLRKKVSAGTLADRFRSGVPFEAEAVKSISRVIALLSEAKGRSSKAKLNKATAQSFLLFFAVLEKYLQNKLTPELVGSFIESFEANRFEFEIGLREGLAGDEKLRALLLRTYEDRSTARVADVLSVQSRDLVLWSWFLLDYPNETAIVTSKSASLKSLKLLLSNQSSDLWTVSSEAAVISLNWGDPLWH